MNKDIRYKDIFAIKLLYETFFNIPFSLDRKKAETFLSLKSGFTPSAIKNF